MGCQNLAVDIGNADSIIVNEIQLSHTAAGQSLHRIATHTADAEDRNPGFLKPLQSLGSQQHLGSQKLFLHRFIPPKFFGFLISYPKNKVKQKPRFQFHPFYWTGNIR